MGLKKTFASLADVFEDGGSAARAQLDAKAGKPARLAKAGRVARPTGLPDVVCHKARGDNS
jgi:hypothetical protein